MRSIALLAIVVAAAACSHEPPEDPSCRPDMLEPDIAYAGPLDGPGVGEGGALKAPPAGKSYAISSTYLRQKRDEATAKRFQTLMAPIAMALANQQGLVAMQLSFSEKCATARTLSVWEDEAAMYRFVTGPAHLEAANAIDEISRGGSIALHWTGSEKDATWDRAAVQLAANQGPVY